jgi:hypothetical protein
MAHVTGQGQDGWLAPMLQKGTAKSLDYAIEIGSGLVDLDE